MTEAEALAAWRRRIWRDRLKETPHPSPAELPDALPPWSDPKEAFYLRFPVRLWAALLARATIEGLSPQELVEEILHRETQRAPRAPAEAHRDVAEQLLKTVGADGAQAWVDARAGRLLPTDPDAVKN